jgi:hypothetical protein
METDVAAMSGEVAGRAVDASEARMITEKRQGRRKIRTFRQIGIKRLRSSMI